MAKFKELGYLTLEDYLVDFQKTLLKSTYTYDYFIDWRKVEANAKQHLVELSSLDALTHLSSFEERKDLLRKLLAEHPRILEVIPLLLAVRESEIEVADLTREIVTRRFDFSPNALTTEKLDDMILFCEKTGVIQLFEKIKDSYSYVLGAEAGLDSHGRKSRSGVIFRNLMDHLLTAEENRMNELGFSFSHKSEVNLEELGVSQTESKKLDFMIYKSGKAIAACEANVYNVQGSKPTEIIRSYRHLNNLLKQRGIEFFWFTDGPAWKKMWKQLEQALRDIDYVMNYSIASKAVGRILKSLGPMTQP